MILQACITQKPLISLDMENAVQVTLIGHTDIFWRKKRTARRKFNSFFPCRLAWQLEQDRRRPDLLQNRGYSD
jgi:hypothetical protein